jgi:hypothetical protein
MDIFGVLGLEDCDCIAAEGGIVRMDCDQNLTFGHTLVNSIGNFFRQSDLSNGS